MQERVGPSGFPGSGFRVKGQRCREGCVVLWGGVGRFADGLGGDAAPNDLIPASIPEEYDFGVS